VNYVEYDWGRVSSLTRWKSRIRSVAFGWVEPGCALANAQEPAAVPPPAQARAIAPSPQLASACPRVVVAVDAAAGIADCPTDGEVAAWVNSLTDGQFALGVSQLDPSSFSCGLAPTEPGTNGPKAAASFTTQHWRHPAMFRDLPLLLIASSIVGGCGASIRELGDGRFAAEYQTTSIFSGGTGAIREAKAAAAEFCGESGHTAAIVGQSAYQVTEGSGKWRAVVEFNCI
jgi:hypothetical protein